MEKQTATPDGVGMCRAEVSSDLVQSVVSNKDTGRIRTARSLQYGSSQWRETSSCALLSGRQTALPMVETFSAPKVRSCFEFAGDLRDVAALKARTCNGERMSLGHGQFNTLVGDGKLIQFRVGFWHEIDEPCIQTAGSYGFQLLQTRRRIKLQFRVGLLLAEAPEGIRNDAPGRILGEADAQRP
jgi:hypothetical protein